MKVCTKCGIEKSVTEFTYHKGKYLASCKHCRAAYKKEWYVNNRKVILKRKKKEYYSEGGKQRILASTYKVSIKEIQKITSNGCCEVCGSTHRLSIDHNHKTGEIRGFLCHNCNAALGFASDNPNRLRILAMYLDQRGGDFEEDGDHD